MVNPRKEKILFVDDEESILDIAEEYFQEKGYQVLTASNGQEAANMLHKNKIDCCFTDINMPEMDGIDLAKYIWRNDKTVPVIIMTGYPSLENAISTLKNGVVDFLIKPVNLSQMELCLERALRERRLLEENIILKQEVKGKDRLKKINEELIKKIDELDAFNRILTEFTTVESSTEAFKSIVDLTIEVTDADESSFWVINEDINRPFFVTSSTKAGGSPKIKKCITQYILEAASEMVPYLVFSNDDNDLAPDISSFISIPLSIREKTFGILTASTYNGASALNEKDLYLLSFMTHKAAYAIENLALYENIQENLFSTLYAFVRAIEAKDHQTRQHSARVAAVALAIGKKMGCGSEELDILKFAGLLHDIGKIGIRDEVFQKKGKLNEEEFEIIKQHATIGAGIVGQLGLWDHEREIIKFHHERWDGTGYPEGLKGEEIPFLVRILSVADVFDALTSDRVYREKMDFGVVVEMIEKQSGEKFDPRIVDVFKKLYLSGELLELVDHPLELN